MRSNSKNYLKKLFLLLFLISFQNISFAEENFFEEDEIVACSNFYTSIKKSDDPRVKNLWPRFYYNDFGFYLKVYDDGDWKPYIDQNGNLLVGEVYSYKALEKLKPGDSIINVNGEKLTSIEQFNLIAYSDDTKILTLDLINQNGEQYEVKLDKHSTSYTLIDYSLKDIYISDINIKKGTATLSLKEAFQYNYDLEDNDTENNHAIFKIAKKYLVSVPKDGKKPFMHLCSPTKEEFKYSGLLDPIDNVTVRLVSSDKDLIQNVYKITPYVAPFNDYNNLRVENTRTSVQTVRNQFNLRSFPFDKQIIKYQFADSTFEMTDRLFWPQTFTRKTLEEFMKLDDISGWHKNKYEVNRILYRDTVDVPGQYRDALSIEIELERKHGYYIFKVILPIILILSVCWSVVWVDPKELEARLTITIVCLLSLIAYNFVIDAELPKLEYLTVLDWIVLISYVYATVPNFLSIISFRLQKTDLSLSNKLEVISKRYGLSSYVLSIFIIVWINAFSNPDNSSSLISWMVPR